MRHAAQSILIRVACLKTVETTRWTLQAMLRESTVRNIDQGRDIAILNSQTLVGRVAKGENPRRQILARLARSQLASRACKPYPTC